MNQIPVVKKGVRAREESFGVLVFTNRTPILALNHDAVAIWNMCDGRHSIADIVNAVTEGDIEELTVAKIVKEFLDAFVELDLIELLPSKQP